MTEEVAKTISHEGLGLVLSSHFFSQPVHELPFVASTFGFLFSFVFVAFFLPRGLPNKKVAAVSLPAAGASICGHFARILLGKP